MNKHIYFLPTLLISTVLIGCSSSDGLEKQLRTYTGGSRMGDATSFFWYTENFSLPYEGSDYVTSTNDQWYQTHYRWLESNVSEIVREGSVIVDDKLVPFSLNLRFNSKGEAVYQQYRVDRKVKPLQANALKAYLKQAEAIAETTKAQRGLALIQGYWDGKQFETCSGEEYDKLEFNKTLPSFVIDRLANVDNYLAFMGSVKIGEAYIEELLMLADDGHDCVKAFKP
ncbi:DUF1481 domain-containing protein [Vibrio sp. RC27]